MNKRMSWIAHNDWSVFDCMNKPSYVLSLCDRNLHGFDPGLSKLTSREGVETILSMGKIFHSLCERDESGYIFYQTCVAAIDSSFA